MTRGVYWGFVEFRWGFEWLFVTFGEWTSGILSVNSFGWLVFIYILGIDLCFKWSSRGIGCIEGFICLEGIWLAFGVLRMICSCFFSGFLVSLTPLNVFSSLTPTFSALFISAYHFIPSASTTYLPLPFFTLPFSPPLLPFLSPISSSPLTLSLTSPFLPVPFSAFPPLTFSFCPLQMPYPLLSMLAHCLIVAMLAFFASMLGLRWCFALRVCLIGRVCCWRLI